MKMKNNEQNKLYPENADFAIAPENFDSTADYLGFISNGMTNNEKIDEFNYYENYLDESASNWKQRGSIPTMANVSTLFFCPDIPFAQ